MILGEKGIGLVIGISQRKLDLVRLQSVVLEEGFADGQWTKSLCRCCIMGS